MSRFARSMIPMILATWLAYAPPGVGSACLDSHGDPEISRLEQAPIASASPASSAVRSMSRPGGSLARPSSWRYRIKSHFEPKDGLGFQPVDLGLAETHDDADVLNLSEQTLVVALLLIPLRC